MKHDICFMNIKEEGVLSLACPENGAIKRRLLMRIIIYSWAYEGTLPLAAKCFITSYYHSTLFLESLFLIRASQGRLCLLRYPNVVVSLSEKGVLIRQFRQLV